MSDTITYRTENRIGIARHPYTKNAGPGKLYVIEHPDLVGGTTVARGLADELGFRFVSYLDGAKGTGTGNLLQACFEHDLERFHPSYFENLVTMACYLTQETILLPGLANGESYVLDRWFTSAFVYGQCRGLPLDYLIALKQFLLVPNAILIVSRDRTLPAGSDRTKEDAFDKEEFQKGVRRGYEWLLGWWKEHVGIVCPIGMIKLSHKDNEEISLRRSLRRLHEVTG